MGPAPCTIAAECRLAILPPASCAYPSRPTPAGTTAHTAPALEPQAFGPAGLGICTVAGVPGFPELRAALLPLAARLAALPAEARTRYEDPASRYNFGWSCGVEALEGGQPDDRKGAQGCVGACRGGSVEGARAAAAYSGVGLYMLRLPVFFDPSTVPPTPHPPPTRTPTHPTPHPHTGSWYANPLLDEPAPGQPELAARFPGFCRPNLWPRGELPQLEGAFKALGRLIIQVGLLLTRHCDKVRPTGATCKPPGAPAVRCPPRRPCRTAGSCAVHPPPPSSPECVILLLLLCPSTPPGRPRPRPQYVSAKAGAPLPRSLHSILADSPCPKGRLLHYFAPAAAENTSSNAAASAAEPAANWCGWHHDSGSLTGLTSAMYLTAGGEPTACPDPGAGLHIRDRSGRVVQVGVGGGAGAAGRAQPRGSVQGAAGSRPNAGS